VFAVVSRLPFETTMSAPSATNRFPSHLVVFGDKAQLAKPLVLHNLYVPRRRHSDPALIEIRAQASVSRRDRSCEACMRAATTVMFWSGLNVARTKTTCVAPAALKVVSTPPIECENCWRRSRGRVV